MKQSGEPDKQKDKQMEQSSETKNQWMEMGGGLTNKMIKGWNRQVN